MDRMSARLVCYATCVAMLIILTSLTACGVKPQSSTIDAVSIEQTPIENQFSIGFCWSYATIGLIESNHKVKTGETINLSEEAIGYLRMRNELKEIATSFRKGSISLQTALESTRGKSLEGWVVRAGDHEKSRDAMELIDDFGLVPESIWSVKFDSPESARRLKSAIQEPFKALLTGEQSISNESLDAVLTAEGAFPSRPPSSLTIDGKTMTSQEYARDVIGFKSSDYVAIRARNAVDSLRLIQIAKKTLAAGYSVPLSFGVSYDNLKGGLFLAPNFKATDLDANPELVDSIIGLNGGHAVLITDFVNINGVEGAIPDEDLQQEVRKSAEQLAYVKFKNSWGAGSSINEVGKNVISSPDGYYRMDLGYIKAIAAKGRFGIVVPRSLVQSM